MATAPPSSGISLADALDVGMPPTWPEAVALVRQLAMALDRRAPPLLVPHFNEVSVLATGALALGQGRHEPDGAVASVGRLLGQLLDRVDCPAALMDVQHRTLASPPVVLSLTELADALAFFARPDAEVELASFYARVAPVVEARPSPTAFDALKEKARAADVPPPIDQARPERRRRVIRALAAAAAVLVALLLWRYQRQVDGWLIGPGSSSMHAAFDSIGAATATARQLASSIIGASPTAPPRNAPTTTPTPSSRTRQPRASLPARADAGGADSSATRVPDETAAELLSREAAPVETEEGRIDVADVSVYSAVDADVQPPMLVHPQMPTVRPGGLPDEKAGHLDLLVLADGTVAEARLVPASTRLQDRLLISAAKAWRFQPATRNGETVPYRVLVQITW